MQVISDGEYLQDLVFQNAKNDTTYFVVKGEKLKLIRAIDAERPALPETHYDIGYNNGLTMAKSIVIKMDAVPVVRCGKCKQWDPDSEYCQFWHGVRHPGHYCGEGERKNDG